MKTQLTILIGLIFSLHPAFSQTDFRPGYVITLEGDSLFGEINYRGDRFLAAECTFRQQESHPVMYKPGEIAAYRFTNDRYFISREIDKDTVFLEYLINGTLNIYFMRDQENNDHYYIDSDSTALTELPYEESTQYISGRDVRVRSQEHKLILNKHMQNTPGFHSKISNLEKPGHRNLIKIAKDYHNAVCEGEECIVYENKKPLFKLNVELAGGTTRYSERNSSYVSEYNSQGAFLMHLWMPRYNERWFFKTGLIFTEVNEFRGPRQLFKIPLHAEYIYPKGVVRPRISFGPNIYSSFYEQSVSISPGVNVRLSDRFFISLTGEVEFTGIIVIPLKYFSHSANAGLFIRL